MNKPLLLCAVSAALLLPRPTLAQEPPAGPDRPQRPNWEQLREELRNLPPEERQARMRELREQFGRPGGQPGERPMAGQFRGQVPPGQAPVVADNGIGRLVMVLTPEQRKSLGQLSEQNREQVRELEQKLREARKESMAAGIARDFDEKTLRAKLEAAAKLEADLAVLRARTLSKIEPPLTDEQIEKVKSPPSMGENFRDRGPDAMQPRPPMGDRPPRDEFPPRERPFRGAPRDGQRPPPDQF